MVLRIPSQQIFRPASLLAALSTVMVMVCLPAAAESLLATNQLEITWRSPAVAGRAADLTVEFRPASEIAPGSTLCIAPHWTQSQTLQNVSPANNGYVTLENAVAIPGSQLQSGDFGGLDSVIPVPCFELAAPVSSSPAALRLSVSGLRLPVQVTDSFRLAAYFSSPGLDSSEPVISNPLVITAGPRKTVTAFASSLAVPGAEIEFWIRQEDEWGNLAEDQALSLDLLINDTYSRRIQMSGAVERIPGISFDAPGNYLLEVRSGGGGLRAIANPIRVSAQDRTVHWLELGQTTAETDGGRSAQHQRRENLGRFDSTLLAVHVGVEVKGSDDSIQDQPFGRWHSGPKETTGAFLSLALPAGQGELVVALAEQPSDFRRLSLTSLGLTQVAAPGADYRWLGDEASRRGYRTGFVGIAHSHKRPEQHLPVYTGVLLERGQTVMDGLLSRQTFVSVGERVFVQSNTLDLGLEAERVLQVDVLAASDVSAVHLYKNGRLLSSKLGEARKDGAFTAIFSSDSSPFSGIESRPRNGREWIGYFEANDSALNVESQSAVLVRQGRNVARVDYYLKTHGDARSLSLLLTDPGPDTVLEIGLAEVFEDTAWLPLDRLPQRMPAVLYQIPLSEIQRGTMRENQVRGYADRLEIKPATQALGTEVSFSFTDSSAPRLGDYYYFKVELVNGGYAYSSPAFVESD